MNCTFVSTRSDRPGKNRFVCTECQQPPVYTSRAGGLKRACNGDAIIAQNRQAVRPPCIHRSPESTGLRLCPSCRGEVRVKTFDCAIHGTCTLSKSLPGIQCCRTCKDYKSAESLQRENAAHTGWAVGVTTARRDKPTLAKTLASLRRTGWDNVHVFADGVHAGDTVRIPAVGAWSNWWLSLAELLQRYPRAERYLLVQDDVQLCLGVREWLESSELPDGILSLYHSARHDAPPGWSKLPTETFVGALAVVLPSAIARRLSMSAIGVERRLAKPNGEGIDTALGQWAHTHGGLWIHNPSLCQHTGETSTLGHSEVCSATFPGEGFDARRLVKPPKKRQSGRIGLVGWNTASGLGYVNRDLAKCLPVDRWLTLHHPTFPALPDCPVESVHRFRPVSDGDLRKFLDGLDVVVFVEMPYLDNLIPLAREMGVRVVCVPMIEHLPPAGYDVDLYLCPTLDCYRHLSGDPRARYVPWPIDLERVRYRQRSRCERFVFHHGTGGRDERKGGLVVAEAARLAPEVPLTVFSQTASGRRSHRTRVIDWPPHVDLREHQDDQAAMYGMGDVALLPSTNEGLGLQFLEAQAAGLPIVATDGPPMNEYEPWRLIRAASREGRVLRPLTLYDADPADLARIMRESLGEDISEASAAARRFAESRTWGPVRREVAAAVCSGGSHYSEPSHSHTRYSRSGGAPSVPIT